MKVNVFTHNFPNSSRDRKNAGIFVYDFCEELNNKVNVVVCHPDKKKKKKKVGSVRVKTFSWFGGKSLGRLKLWNPLDIVRFISLFYGGFTSIGDLEKVDINIAMWAFPSGVFAYLAKRIHKTPYIVWCLGSDIYIYAKLPIIRSVVKKVLKNADYVFADGIDLGKKVERLLKRECIFLPSASKVEFRKSKATKKDKDKIVLTFMGRMESVKGPDIFLEALVLLKKDLSKYKINYIGDGSLLTGLKQRVKEEGVDKHIKFYGNINDFQRISDILKGSDWLVIPSRSDSIPLVFSEAMKNGLPIIASDLLDLEYLIDNYKVGYIFKKENINSLERVLGELSKAKEERSIFVNNTKSAAKDFDLKTSADKLLGFLKKIK